MTKFGVYHGKDKAFAKRFASGGPTDDKSTDYGSTDNGERAAARRAEYAADSRLTRDWDEPDPTEQMRKAAKWRQDFYAKNPTYF